MKRIFGTGIYSLSFLLIPAAVTAAVLLTIISREWFYISAIKNLDVVRTFIEVKNIQLEGDIRKEIEKTTGMSQFREKYNAIKKTYEEKLLAYDTINKTYEYKKIDKQIDELDDLKWAKSSDEFRTEDDFDRFKKLKMSDLKAARKEIKDYRDKNDRAIDTAEDAMKEAKKKFSDADDDMKKIEEKAKDIIESRRGDFMNEMYSDIARIEPALTENLNNLFIDREFRRVIRTYLDFFSSWKRQKDAGYIRENRLSIHSGSIENTKSVTIPTLTMSLMVNTGEHGSVMEKNLLSGVFVDIIRTTPALRSPWVLTRIFSMSDTWLAEVIGNKVLAGTGITIDSGVIKSQKIVFTGKKAEAVEKIMKLMTAAKYVPWCAAALVSVLILLVVFSAPDKKTGIRRTGRALKYSSGAMIISGIAALIIALKPDLMVHRLSEDPFMAVFLEKVLLTAALHLVLPLVAIFMVLSLTGGLLAWICRK